MAYWRIPFAAWVYWRLNYTFCSERRSNAAAKIADAFEWPEQPRKLPWGICTSIEWSTRVFNQNGISIGSAVFFRTANHKVSRYFAMGRYVPPKLPLPLGALRPPSNAWYLRPTRVISPNGILISFADLHDPKCYAIQYIVNGGRKPQILPVPLGISSPNWRRTKQR